MLTQAPHRDSSSSGRLQVAPATARLSSASQLRLRPGSLANILGRPHPVALRPTPDGTQGTLVVLGIIRVSHMQGRCPLPHSRARFLLRATLKLKGTQGCGWTGCLSYSGVSCPRKSDLDFAASSGRHWPHIGIWPQVPHAATKAFSSSQSCPMSQRLVLVAE